MYRFVDQSLDRQDDGTRFLVWAMRQWVAGAVHERCVCRVLSAAFAGVGAERALDDFHIAMRTLCHNALVPLHFGALERPLISEHEAVLVATVIAAAERDEAEVKAIARQLVHADMAALLARALAGVARCLARAGLVLAAGQGGGGREDPGRRP